MDRMACVDLPAFALQILLRHHPDWLETPAAVIDKDHPQGRLLWVNEHARGQRILPGMRYAAALALSRDLRASVISAAVIETESETLQKRLHFYAPEVEQDRHDPGTFWLGADGLGLLHPSCRRWAELIRTDLTGAGYDARVAVGFSRFGSYAAARVAGSAAGDRSGGDHAGGQPGGHTGDLHVVVFESVEEERAAIRRIPVDRIACDPDFRDTLARLGIFELGGFIDLPASGLRRRFGEEALRLHEKARGESWTPFLPLVPEDPYERRVVLDAPESDTTRLREIVGRELRPLLERLRARDRALTAFTLELGFDRPGPDGIRRASERLSPATPTRDLELLLDLLRLRLESARLPCGVVDLRLEVSWTSAAGDQLSLFAQRARRDLDAANRALARVRAGFGENAVCTAEPREAHLPEARFVLRPVQQLGPAHPPKARRRVLVRRLLNKPAPISLDRRVQRGEGLTLAAASPSPAGMKIRGLGTIEEASGPFLISGGWWKRPVIRHYWYVRVGETCDDLSRGRPAAAAFARSASPPGRHEDTAHWCWIFHDTRRHRWCLQGEVD